MNHTQDVHRTYRGHLQHTETYTGRLVRQPAGKTMNAIVYQAIVYQAIVSTSLHTHYSSSGPTMHVGGRISQEGWKKMNE